MSGSQTSWRNDGPKPPPPEAAPDGDLPVAEPDTSSTDLGPEGPDEADPQAEVEEQPS